MNKLEDDLARKQITLHDTLNFMSTWTDQKTTYSDFRPNYSTLKAHVWSDLHILQTCFTLTTNKQSVYPHDFLTKQSDKTQ